MPKSHHISRIECSAEAKAQILRLMQSRETSLSPRSRKRLMALLSLCQGESVLKASRQAGLSREGVREIRNSAEKLGVDALVSKIASAKDKKEQAKNHVRVRGTAEEQVDRVWSKLKPKAEPVIVVVALIVQPTAKLAIFGFRGASKSKRVDKEVRFSARGSELARAISRAIESGTEVEDFESIPNRWMSQATLDMPTQPKGTSEFDSGIPSRDLDSLPSAGLRLGTGWGFHAIQAGDREVCTRMVRRLLNKRRCVTTGCSGEEFFSRLAAACSRLRLSWNTVGLFPVGFVTSFAIRAWRSLGKSFKFTYWLNESEIDEGVRASLLAFYHLGYGFGFVNQMTAAMLGNIRGSTSFLIRAAPLRPLVKIEGEGIFADPADDWGVTWRGVPGGEGNFVVYDPDVPYKTENNAKADLKILRVKKAIASPLSDLRKIKSDAKAVRKVLRENGAIVSLRYVVRLDDAESIEVDNSHFVKKDGHTLKEDGYLLDEDRSLSGKHNSVILFPRHFLMGEPSVNLLDLARIAEDYRREKLEGVRAVKGRPDLLVFHSEAISKGIRSAFENNRISRTAERFKLACEELLKTYSGRLFGQFPPKDWPSWTRLRHEFICPYHYFTQEQRTGKMTGHLRSDLAWEGYDPKTLSKTGSKFPKAYSPDKSLRNVYRDLDADFLLRHIDGENWDKIRDSAEKWRERIEELVGDDFSPKGHHAHGPMTELVPAQHSAGVKKGEVDASTIRNDAFIKFVAGTVRVLRGAVENAQRLVLAGHPPSAIVVLSKKQILASWKTFLRKRLKRLFDSNETPGGIVSSTKGGDRIRMVSLDDVSEGELMGGSISRDNRADQNDDDRYSG